MKKCEWCEKLFDEDEAEYFFHAETFLLSYDNLRECLCGQCAVDVIENRRDGVYYEDCEKCGKTFDLISEMSDFDSHFPPYNGCELRDFWDLQILCCDCALKKIEKDMEEIS